MAAITSNINSRLNSITSCPVEAPSTFRMPTDFRFRNVVYEASPKKTETRQCYGDEGEKPPTRRLIVVHFHIAVEFAHQARNTRRDEVGSIFFPGCLPKRRVQPSGLPVSRRGHHVADLVQSNIFGHFRKPEDGSISVVKAGKVYKVAHHTDDIEPKNCPRC